MDPLAIAASGIRSAETRLAASAHNVANLGTRSFRPLTATQTAVRGGGSAVYVRQEPLPREVELPRELVEQIRAASQLRASLRVLAVAAETRGHLIDVLA